MKTLPAVLVMLAVAARAAKLAAAFLRWLLSPGTLALALAAGGCWAIVTGVDQLWGKGWAHLVGGVLAVVAGALLARVAVAKEDSDGQ